MALYIRFAVPDIITGRPVDVNKKWKVGDNPHLLENPRYAEEVQANGNELKFIKAHFTNLPQAPEASIITWYGDHAKFIVANLIG